MIRTLILAIVAAAVLLAAPPAMASDKAPPKFSFAEEVIIARNDALNELLPLNPWGVRKILDTLAAVKQQPAGPKTPRYRDVFGTDGAPKESLRLDPLKNPDLDILFQRASPEAAYDLFQILKQVGKQSVAN
jgi:hypothetical protein